MAGLKPTKKSGFAEGRSASQKGTRSKKATGAQLRLNKLEKAADDLSEIMMEEKKLPFDIDDDEDEDRPRGALGNDIEKDQTLSSFKEEMGHVRSMVAASNEDFNAEAANRALTRVLLKTTLDLIPVAEHNFRKSGKEQAGYVLVALSNQAKELSADLRLLNDTDTQGDFIAQRILTPNFTAQVQNLLSELMVLKSIIDTQIGVKAPNSARKLKEQVDTTLRTVGQFMDASNRKMADNIQSYLSGDMSFVQPDASNSPRKKRRGPK